LCASAIVTIFIEIFNKESYAHVLVARKTARLSREFNRQDLRSRYRDEDTSKTKRERLRLGMTGPLRMLFLSPIVVIFSIYMALVYGLLYLLLTTITTVYANVYHWAPEITGLGYLGIIIGLGFFAGLAVCRLNER
jgi:Flp pilus assembly protein TadB